MPAQEVQQPQAQQMPSAQEAARINAEQPRSGEQMTAEPVTMRGGGEGEEVCCGM
ncbi:hypothetical protein EG329_012480 [Mollisiaceae sp. DMI_Dod_QoI]|nr:hypothetical protein EG329_012480 [Helotiales sp. DMI_Dod_QoI]